ncbi:DinB family protein [Saccharibacillus sp. CPCC 101409]|uniref:DinB family protein n=1 Tax=Saccharibacillus sp. CPCC 101409 TaxID=3058041 RepID=UPI002673EAD4|nr:DinB family protein [Saccharibacillus sp. CPCC 101409]MDO3411069.1 DinB family protein [Saccharibacillus sp. CPCC 101409]
MREALRIRDHLLDELETGVRTGETLIRRIRAEDWTYRPQDNMRSLPELVRHFALVPRLDLEVMQEAALERVQEIEAALDEETDPERLASALRESFDLYKAYIVSLTPEELLDRSTRAFYAEDSHTQIQWQIETLTHLFHHRSQLYNYLKQHGHELHFSMLYM